MLISARQAEAAAERQREELEQTLDALRDNLRPDRLVQEALSGGHWFERLQGFARNSPISWTIMTIAAVGFGVRSARRTSR